MAKSANDQDRRDLEISLANYRNLLENRIAAMRKISSMAGPHNPRYQRAELAVELTSQDLSDKKNDVGGRPPHIQLENSLIFWSISILVAIAEVLANKELFDMMFMGSAAKSLLVATVLSVSLFILAHTAGASTRQIWSDSVQRWVPSKIFLAFVTTSTVLLSVLILMIIRAYFSEASDTSLTGGNLFGGLADKAQNAGLLGMTMQAFNSIEALGLGIFNLVCLIGAFLIGFLSHDSDVHYDKSYRNLTKAKRALEVVERKYDAELNSIYRAYAKRIELAKQSYVNAKAKTGEQVGTELPEDNFASDRHTIEQEHVKLKGTVKTLKAVS